jgi:hypothetical protein
MRFFFILMISMMSLQAQEIGVFERPAAKIECLENLKRCTYTAQNISARELVSKLNAVVFPGTILSPDEGYISVESVKKLAFWMENEALRERYSALIPLIDVYEDFVVPALVQVSTEVFSLSENALGHLQAEVTAAGTNADITDWSLGSLGGGTLDLTLRIGSKFLSSVLGSRRVRSESSRVTTVTQLLPNRSDLNYNHTTNVYMAFESTGVVKEEKVGLSLNGEISISSSDPELVMLKDFSFRYGVLDESDTEGGSDRVTILAFGNPQLALLKGVSNMLVSTMVTEDTNSREWGLLSLGRTRDQVRSKLMVVTRAEAVSFDTYVEEMRRLRDLELFGQFSPLQVESFPLDERTIDQVVASARPYAFFTTSGDRVLGFRMDRALAREGNIKKNLEIEVTARGGLKQKAIRTIENLMLTGFKFDSLPLSTLDRTKVDLKVTVKEYGGRGKWKKTFVYNPDTNTFIE